MKTLELLNIEELNRLVGGETKETLIDSVETAETLIDSVELNRTSTKALAYDFSKLTALTK